MYADVPIYIADISASMDKRLPERGPNVYKSGLKDEDKADANYGPSSNDEPTLSIIDPIFDVDRNVIYPGYYELSLSDDKKILRLTQSQKLIATIPIFKYEDNRSEEELKQPMDSKSLRKLERKKKKKLKKFKKDVREGKILTEPQTYNKATIEFDEQEGYYLIKYERGKIEAWGALKTRY